MSVIASDRIPSTVEDVFESATKTKLRLEGDQQAARISRSESVDILSRYHPEVLIVEEDFREAAEIASVVAKLNGGVTWRVYRSRSLSEANSLLALHGIDVILVNPVMSQDSWSSVLGWATQTRVPFVLVTDSTEAEVVQAGVRAGASGFLLKPTNPDQLRLHVLQAFLSSMEAKERGLCEDLQQGKGLCRNRRGA